MEMSKMKELAEYIREQMMGYQAEILTKNTLEVLKQGGLRYNREEIEIWLTDGVQELITNGAYSEIPGICIEDTQEIVNSVLQKLDSELTL